MRWRARPVRGHGAAEAPAGEAAIDRVYQEQGVSLLVLGKGKVGSELLEQIRTQRTELERDYDTVLRVVGMGFCGESAISRHYKDVRPPRRRGAT